MLDKMCAELLKPHLIQGPNRGGREDVGAVKVQEDGANGEHLAGVLLPAAMHLAQKEDLICSLAACQPLYLCLCVPVTGLHDKHIDCCSCARSYQGGSRVSNGPTLPMLTDVALRRGLAAGRPWQLQDMAARFMTSERDHQDAPA